MATMRVKIRVVPSLVPPLRFADANSLLTNLDF
jgi:hypothetical protein